jgi:hypothetical protein
MFIESGRGTPGKYVFPGSWIRKTVPVFIKNGVSALRKYG